MSLTDTRIRQAKPKDKAYKLSDGAGLHLEVRPTGAKLWRLRYRLAGKENVFAIGRYPEVDLKGARSDRDAAKKIIKDRYNTGVYQAPERAGISYMLSPLLRAYQNLEQDNTIGTFNFPHYMFYAPNVHNEDIGGSVPAGTYPWAFRPGPHGYIILRVGEKEIADINEEHEGMLARVCELKKEFCLAPRNDH